MLRSTASTGVPHGVPKQATGTYDAAWFKSVQTAVALGESEANAINAYYRVALRALYRRGYPLTQKPLGYSKGVGAGCQAGQGCHTAFRPSLHHLPKERGTQSCG